MQSKSDITIVSGANFEVLLAARAQFLLTAQLLCLKKEALLEVGFTRSEAIELIKEKAL